MRPILVVVLLISGLAAFTMFGHSPRDAPPQHLGPARSGELEQRAEPEIIPPDAPSPLASGAEISRPASATGIVADAIHVSGQRLSLAVSYKSLRTILDEVYRQSGITVVLSDEIRDARVSLRFDDYPVERGLQRLLSQYDSFFFFSPSDDGSARLTTVWVYPKGRGQGLAPVPSPLEANSDDLRQEALDPDLLKRAAATATLIERNGNDAVETVKTGLADPDAQVRIQTLDAALRTAVDLAPDLLRALAQQDPSPTVRALALVGLTENGENDAATDSDVWELVEAARHDPAPEVSNLARHLVEGRRTVPETSDEAGPQNAEREDLQGETTN